MAATTVHERSLRDPTGFTPPPPGGRARMGGRVSRGHVVMIVAGLVGVVLSFAVLRERDGDTRVLVAAHEIRAGELVSPSDFRSEPVTMRAAVLGTVLRAGERSRLAGRVAAHTIMAGELVSRSTLRSRAAPNGRRAMSIPIDPAPSGRRPPRPRRPCRCAVCRTARRLDHRCRRRSARGRRSG